MRNLNKFCFCAITVLCILLLLQFKTTGEEKKPQFVLPDVLVKGDSEVVIIGFRYLPFLSVPTLIAIEKTPAMDFDNLKLSLLSETKFIPPYSDFKIMTKPASGKYSFNRLFEMDLSYGLFNDLLFKLVHGQQLEKFNYIIGGEVDRTDGFTANSSKGRLILSSGMDYAFDRNFIVNMNSSYKNFSLEMPYADISSYHRLDKSISETNVFSWISPLKDVTLGLKFYIISSKLVQQFESDNLTGLLMNASVPFDMFTRHLFWISLGVENDSIYHSVVNFSVEDRFEINPLRINLGCRADGPRVSPLARIFYGTDEKMTVYIKYEPFLKYNSFHELYGNLIYNEVNKNIKPALYWFSLVGGVQHVLFENLKTTLEIFDKEIEDFAIWTDSNNNRMFEPVNVNKVSAFGANIKFDWEVFANFTQSISYSYQNYRNVQDSNKFITYIPYNIFTIDWKYIVPDAKKQDNFWDTLESDLNLNIVGPRYYEENTGNVLNTYYLLNLKIYKQLSRQVKIFVNFSNLLNQKYEIWANYPELSTAFSVGTKILF